MIRPNRAKRTVLVTDAHTLGAIGVIRSLGRAGYRVIAISPESEALGLKSNFATSARLAPSYESSNYIGWLRALLVQFQISLIIPSEAFLHALRPCFDEFSHLLPLPEDEEIAYRAFSKVAVTERLSDSDADPVWSRHLPPSLIWRAGSVLPGENEIATLGLPIFVKSDACLNRYADEPLLARCESTSDVIRVVEANAERFDAILIEGFVPGCKAASAYCIDDKGDVVTKSSVLGLRTTPHTGGMMSVRQTWAHPEMERLSLEWLRHLDWCGVAMVECKWDPETDRFWLIEINARYWGYLHLDLYAGSDVPRLQADRFFEFPHEQIPTTKLGVRCRHAFPGDAGWLISRLKDRGVSGLAKLGDLVRFASDFVDPRLSADLMFPGDRALYWRAAAQYGRRLAAGGIARITRKLITSES